MSVCSLDLGTLLFFTRTIIRGHVLAWANNLAYLCCQKEDWQKISCTQLLFEI